MKIPAIKFKQWIRDWDNLNFDESEFRRRPPENIYIFSMPARQLRALSGVFRRQRHNGQASGIQRGHDKERSAQIRDFVRFGYPYSDMSPTRRKTFDSEDLRKPGWLPTAIVVNILTPDDQRRGRCVAPQDAITVEDSRECSSINLPDTFDGSNWEAENLPPLEIIDGQHRLYAFDDEGITDDFELPVVAFYGLDIGWQAYLFWSINVSPKKINPSHAFDLYPLLRSQDWLEKFAESSVYREARAQELTEILFRHAESPWRNRINMLGERGIKGISQAAWIRSLSGTFLSAGRGRSAKGLFGCNISITNGPLNWTRSQQAAFLIFIWQEMRVAVKASQDNWALALRSLDVRQDHLGLDENVDLAFSGPSTMLNQEQGVRGFMSVINDIFFSLAEDLNFSAWESNDDRGASTDDEEIDEAITSLRAQDFVTIIRDVIVIIATYDWRSADAHYLSSEEKLRKRAFRGSGGYAALRDELMRLLRSNGSYMPIVIRKFLGARE